ncbi:hypothetical protein GCM10022396_40230 [Flavivirga amylovorans]
MVSNGSTLKVPYFSNYDFESPKTSNNAIEHVVVVVHGNKRNADVYYNNMVKSAEVGGKKLDNTVIVAPNFLTEADIVSKQLDDTHIYWSSGGWKSGSKSKSELAHPRPENISSYAVFDTLLTRLSLHLPKLKSIVCTGHSAGGQFITRYAGSTPIIERLERMHQIDIKFIVANPSSYFYLNDLRPKRGSTDVFEVPTIDCSKYNDWKYGLNDVYEYQRNVGVDSMVSMYAKRDVLYLLGAKDNDPGSSSLDKSCEAMLQGSNRLERGLAYYNYLKVFYGDSITKTHKLEIVPNAGHSNFQMYSSKIGVKHLFM